MINHKLPRTNQYISPKCQRGGIKKAGFYDVFGDKSFVCDFYLFHSFVLTADFKGHSVYGEVSRFRSRMTMPGTHKISPLWGSQESRLQCNRSMILNKYQSLLFKKVVNQKFHVACVLIPGVSIKHYP
jgi:hypothetical protein